MCRDTRRTFLCIINYARDAGTEGCEMVLLRDTARAKLFARSSSAERRRERNIYAKQRISGKRRRRILS